ncbi:MAG: LysE family translocator [Burkholderiales bacterium]|jgi:threonine/homoserine/homoserine lactone efflux protein|nr:LysE family translocator [Burkholderiales bacterium]
MMASFLPGSPMLGFDQSLLFLAAAVLVTLAPGPDNLMIISLGMARGCRAGVAFALGCALGCLNHTLLVVLGVSAAIAASPHAFMALRIAGGAYLIWLGFIVLKSTWRRSVITPVTDSVGAPSASLTPAFQQAGALTLFTRGLVANAVNPKVIVFFLAFLPQFVEPARGMIGWQLATLGLLFTTQAALIFSTIGFLAGSLGQRLARDPRIALWLDRLAGVVFVGLGLRLLWA